MTSDVEIWVCGVKYNTEADRGSPVLSSHHLGGGEGRAQSRPCLLSGWRGRTLEGGGGREEVAVLVLRFRFPQTVGFGDG